MVAWENSKPLRQVKHGLAIKLLLLLFYFFREFQLMTSILNDSLLISDQNTN